MCRYRVKGQSCLTWNSHFVRVLPLRVTQNYFAGLRVKQLLEATNYVHKYLLNCFTDILSIKSFSENSSSKASGLLLILFV